MKHVAIAACLCIASSQVSAIQPDTTRVAADESRWLAASTWPTLHAPVVVAELDRAGKLRQQRLNADGSVAPDPAEAFRIASVTKTFVAATVLRLAEEKRLQLDDLASAHLAPEITQQLRDDGYDMDVISLRHLLTHTSGMSDHAQQPQFIETWKRAPKTFWTRERHLQALVEWADPLAAPGEKFAYSDSGYVLLGQVVERVAGKPLAVAVREALALDGLGMRHTWWEQSEPPRAPRAHQWLDGADTYDWNASLDLYGGGGLVAPMSDIACFFQSLMTGRVFKDPATLDQMLSARGLPSSSPYRIGIFRYTLDGKSYYGHAGYWGIYVAHDPRNDRTVAIAASDQRDYRAAKALAEQHLVALARQQP